LTSKYISEIPNRLGPPLGRVVCISKGKKNFLCKEPRKTLELVLLSPNDVIHNRTSDLSDDILDQVTSEVSSTEVHWRCPSRGI